MRSAQLWGEVLHGQQHGPDGIGGACKGHEETISLCVHLMAIPLAASGMQELSILRQHEGVVVAQLLKQLRGPLDVGEEHRHGSRWQVWHTEPPCVSAACVSPMRFDKVS